MRTRVKIIANPVSGRGASGRRAEAVIRNLRRLGCACEFAETRKSGDARALASETAGFDAVACVGGDGTVNEVLNGLPAKDAPPLAMIPTGTANVLAKELRLPRCPRRIARLITEGREERMDLGLNRATNQKFLLFAGAGFDSVVVEDFHRRRKGRIHMYEYIGWGLKTIPFYRAPRLSVEIDGRLVDEDAAWVQVASVAKYGGPLQFTPSARYNDGLFDVMIQKGRHVRDTLRMFFAALTRATLSLRYDLTDVDFVRGKKVRIWPSDGNRVPLQIDGDPGGELPADIEIIPAGARVLVP